MLAPTVVAIETREPAAYAYAGFIDLTVVAIAVSAG